MGECVCMCVYMCVYMCVPRSLVKASEVPDHYYPMLLVKWLVLEQSSVGENSMGVVAKDFCLFCHTLGFFQYLVASSLIFNFAYHLHCYYKD